MSVEFLLRVAQATPEQQAAIERFLRIGVFEREAPRARFSFTKAGAFWRVVFNGGPEFCIEDTLGARYLDFLLHRPNQPIPAFDLERAISPDKALARTKDTISERHDSEAARRYLRELAELRRERDDAVAEGRATERLDEEIEALEEAIRRGAQAGTDSGERARNNVRKAIGAVLRGLSGGQPDEREFADHLRGQLSTGYECLYAQSPGMEWA